MLVKSSYHKKVVYFGIDALIECLELINKKEYEIVKLFTMPDDSYDKTIKVQEYAKTHDIPYTTNKVKKEDIELLEKSGVELIIVAGYSWKIPISKSIKQINIHPAYLPVGRGSWPMPVAILKGVNLGVTIHKLSDGFDEGDIIIQEKIEIKNSDNLVTLLEKIKKISVKLLDIFLNNIDKLWESAYPQGDGEYWQEPKDLERTICLTDCTSKIANVLRAFYGYGTLCNLNGIPIEIIKGQVISNAKKITKEELCYKLADGYLYCEEWRLNFKEIELKDKEKVESIRKKYNPELSDYTFALLYCWQEEMQLSIYIEEDLYVVKSIDYFFFPVGAKAKVKNFIDGLIDIGIKPKFRFCDSSMLEFMQQNYKGKYDFYMAQGDCDYLVLNKTINELKGSDFAKRRNAYVHYSKLEPKPQVEIITKDNISNLKVISELFSGLDKSSEMIAIEHFFELDMIGIIVKRGEEYVGFSICSQKSEKVMQGHFMKCISLERGSKFYLMKSCIDVFSDRFDYTNMEDDMGQEGLRIFKSSFNSEIISSYTIIF